MAFPSLICRALLAGLLVLSPPARADQIVEFAEGLIVDIPLGFSVEREDDILHITQTEPVRTPLTLSLSIDPNFHLREYGIPTRRGDVSYIVNEHGGGGSGGAEYELRALRVLPGGIRLALVGLRQAERRPDFSSAFDVLLSVRRRLEE